MTPTAAAVTSIGRSRMRLPPSGTAAPDVRPEKRREHHDGERRFLLERSDPPESHADSERQDLDGDYGILRRRAERPHDQRRSEAHRPDLERLLWPPTRNVDGKGRNRHHGERHSGHHRRGGQATTPTRGPAHDRRRKRRQPQREHRETKHPPDLRAPSMRRRSERVPLDRVPDDPSRPIPQLLRIPPRQRLGELVERVLDRSPVVDHRREGVRESRGDHRQDRRDRERGGEQHDSRARIGAARGHVERRRAPALDVFGKGLVGVSDQSTGSQTTRGCSLGRIGAFLPLVKCGAIGRRRTDWHGQSRVTATPQASGAMRRSRRHPFSLSA